MEGDDRDLLLLDDRQDPLPGMSPADVEVVQTPGPVQVVAPLLSATS